MHDDIYNRQILTEKDLCEMFLVDPSRTIKNAIVDREIKFDDILELNNIPTLITNIEPEISVNKFHRINQNNWYIPDTYKEMDIAKYVLDLCKTEEELQRVGEELLLFQERDMFPLLRYCKYLVDIMREHNIVWGVGRGSSVSSYVLYLIGVHRINSIHYGLPIDEFLK